MPFTIVDIAIVVITVLSGLLASSRGFTREMFAIGGWIVAAVAAFYGAPVLEPLLREAPVVGEKLAASCVLSILSAFTIVLAIALAILSVFTPIISHIVLDSALGSLDRLLGFLFGVARGVLLIAVAFLIYTHFSGEVRWAPLDNATLRALFEESATLIEQNLPEAVPEWFGEKVDALMVSCGDLAPTLNEPATGTEGAATEGAATEGAAEGTATTGTTGN
ncbi:MAG TPA: CvpA family protein [Thermohalobaculum sp.]|nr:CvpA family protein [Thermohalobaculum sp.]